MKRYSAQIVIRVLLLSLTAIAAAGFLVKGAWYSVLTLALVLLLQVFLFIRYMHGLNRDLLQFFDSLLRQDPTARSMPRPQQMVFPELLSYLEELNQTVRLSRIEKEEQFQLLRFIIRNLKVGLLITGEEEKVLMSNPMAEQLLGIHSMTSLLQLKKTNPEVYGQLHRLKAGEKRLAEWGQAGLRRDYSIAFHEFILAGSTVGVLMIQDLQKELEEKETESWKKLIRVLTHEIMNSVTPITTLTAGISRRLMKEGKPMQIQDMQEETIPEVLEGLELIRERGDSLMHFVRKYRKVHALAAPEPEELEVAGMLRKVADFFRASCGEKGIAIDLRVMPEEMLVHADPHLLEQVLINLVQNALDALENREDGQIHLHALSLANGSRLIEVTDNGPGIPAAVMDDIFIPFFTTREKGSGIGLSLTRQIMALHGGQVTVRSKPGETVFRLTF